jgi:3-oxoacyl-[acyl-carrier protein] reductase
MKFKNNSLLVSGSGSKLGTAFCLKAASAGLKVFAGCREASLERLNDVFAGVKNIEPVVLDYSDGEFDSLLELVALKSAESDVSPGYFVDLAHPDYQSLIGFSGQVEVEEYYVSALINRIGLIRQVEKIMLKGRQGRMLFVSSAAVARQNPGQAFYASSKAAVEEIYRGIAVEAGSKGISTVILRPGYISCGRGAEFLKSVDKPVKSLSIEEVVDTMLFLLSDAALNINGSIVTMDCGAGASK